MLCLFVLVAKSLEQMVFLAFQKVKGSPSQLPAKNGVILFTTAAARESFVYFAPLTAEIVIV